MFGTDEIHKDKDKDIKVKIGKMQRSGKIIKAIQLCQKALLSDPMNADLHISLGDLYVERHLDIYQAKQFIDDAITEYQRALESNLDSPEINYKLGVAFFHKGELERAISYFNIAISFDKEHADSYFMLARTLMNKDRFSEAYENVQKSIKFGGIKVSRAYTVAHQLLSLGLERGLKHRLKRHKVFIMSLITLPFDPLAIKELKNKLHYLKFFPVIFKGYYLEKTKSNKKAIEVYKDLIENVPGFLPSYILLGDIYKEMGEYEEAINEYRMALWFDPLNIPACKSLCQAYEEQGDYENAIEIYKKLAKIHPNDAVIHSNMANLYYLLGEVKKAISCYHTAITLNPNKDWTSVIAQTLGYVFQEGAENHDAAITAYQSANLLNPTDIDIYISLGSAFYDKGDYDNALSVYRVALEIDPNNARIHCNLGYLLWGKGEIDESIKEYELSIALDPGYDIAYNNLGVIYLDDLYRIKKSVELFEKAIECNPNYALAYYNLGRAVAMQADKIEAARVFQIALDLNSVTNELDSADIKAKIDELFE